MPFLYLSVHCSGQYSLMCGVCVAMDIWQLENLAWNSSWCIPGKCAHWSHVLLSVSCTGLQCIVRYCLMRLYLYHFRLIDTYVSTMVYSWVLKLWLITCMHVCCVACVVSPAGDLAYDLFDVSVQYFIIHKKCVHSSCPFVLHTVIIFPVNIHACPTERWWLHECSARHCCSGTLHGLPWEPRVPPVSPLNADSLHACMLVCKNIAYLCHTPVRMYSSCSSVISRIIETGSTCQGTMTTTTTGEVCPFLYIYYTVRMKYSSNLSVCTIYKCSEYQTHSLPLSSAGMLDLYTSSASPLSYTSSRSMEWTCSSGSMSGWRMT